MKVKILAASIFLLSVSGVGFNLSAQENEGLLRLFILPKPETIMVNDSVLKYGNKITLPEGKHQLRIWAPSYELLDTTITITAGSGFDFFYELKHHADYYAYEERYNKYKAQRRLHFNVPLLSTIALVGTSIYTYVDASKAYDEVGRALEEYEFATIDLDERYNDYIDLSKQYRTKRVYFYTSVGLTAVSGYFLYKGIQWRKKNPAEEYVPGENPLSLHNIYLLPSNSVNGGYSLGFTFNFKH